MELSKIEASFFNIVRNGSFLVLRGTRSRNNLYAVLGVEPNTPDNNNYLGVNVDINRILATEIDLNKAANIVASESELITSKSCDLYNKVRHLKGTKETIVRYTFDPDDDFNVYEFITNSMQSIYTKVNRKQHELENILASQELEDHDLIVSHFVIEIFDFVFHVDNLSIETFTEVFDKYKTYSNSVKLDSFYGPSWYRRYNALSYENLFKNLKKVNSIQLISEWLWQFCRITSKILVLPQEKIRINKLIRYLAEFAASSENVKDKDFVNNVIRYLKEGDIYSDSFFVFLEQVLESY